MPTGYTYKVADGDVTTLRDFALECIKAFLIEYRDQPSDTPILVNAEPDTYYYDRVQEGKARDEALANPDSEELKAEYAEYLAATDWRETYNEEKIVKRQRYSLMIEKTKQWAGPQQVKDFMLSQLRESLQFDCGDGKPEVIPAKMSFEEWYAEEIRTNNRELVYYQEQHEANVAKTQKRNAFVQEFLDSLPSE